MAEQKRKPASEDTVESLFFDMPEGMATVESPAPLPTQESTVESLFFDDPTAGMIQEQPTGFGAVEIGSRALTSGLKGYSFGASELVRAPLSVAANRLERMLTQGNYDEALSFTQEWQEELKRQQEFEKEYPIVSGTMEGLGAISPQSLAMKATGVLAKGTDALSKRVLGAATEAGLQGVAYQAASSPEDERMENMLIGGALSAGIGGAVPVVGAGLEKGITKAAPIIDKGLAAAQKVQQAVLKAGEPGIGMLFGVSKQLRQKYVKDGKTIDETLTREQASKIFQEMQDRMKVDAVTLAEKIDDLKAKISKQEQDLAYESQRASKERTQELAAKQKELSDVQTFLANLEDEQTRALEAQKQLVKTEQEGAEVRLKELQQASKEELEDVQYAKSVEQEYQLSEAQKAAKFATEEFKEASKIPRPEPEVQSVEDALETLMSNAMSASKAAQELLDPSVRVSRSIVLDAIKEQQDKLVIPGTEFTAGPMEDARQELKRLVKKATEPETGLPEEMTGEQTKKFLLMVSARLNELKAQGKGTDAPYAYAHPAYSSLFQIYGKVSKGLKSASGAEAYAKKMVEVAPLFDLYEDLTKQNFKTPASIRSSLNRSTADPKIQKQLQSLREKTGIDVTDYVERRKHAEKLRQYGPQQAAIETLPAVQQLELLQEKIAAAKSPKAKRELERSLPMYQAMVDQEAQVEALRRSRQARIEASPEYQQLEQTKKLISLAKGNAFAQDVLEQVDDKEAAGQIIKIFNEIEVLKNPIEQAHQLGLQMNLGESALQNLQDEMKFAVRIQNQLKKVMEDIALGVGDDPGQDLISRILKNPHEEQMSPVMAKVVQALDKLDEDAYTRWISQVALLKPGTVEQTMKNLRIRTAMDEPLDKATRVKAWRTMVLLTSLKAASMGAEGGVLGEAMRDPKNPFDNYVPYAIAAIGGWQLADYMTKNGGAITRSYLRRAYGIQGIPSIKKLMDVSPVRVSDAMRLQMTYAAQDWVSSFDDDKREAVSAQNAPMIELDIHASDMRMSDKIKALNELRTKGTISGKVFKQLVLQGSLQGVAEESSDTRLNVPQEPQPEEMLSRMAKKKKAT